MTTPKEPSDIYNFVLNGVAHQTLKRNVTGAYIRAYLFESQQQYHQLYIEKHDGKPDDLFKDDNTCSLEKGSVTFYSVPNERWDG